MCRVNMSDKSIGRVAVLEDEVKAHPAECHWDCQQAGLTLGDKLHHESSCSRRVMSCVCGFTAICTEHKKHQEVCIKYHTEPLTQKIASLG